MFAGGVRSSAARPALPKRELKKLAKMAKAEAKAAAKAGASISEGDDDRRDRDSDSTPERETAGANATVDAPTEPATSWETPWWEDRQPTMAD